ncbi:DUF3800 domain-containing protein [Ramlibacter sp. PS4R-6]|uniref:DUF3800 domain-containing protein n=1 Tax=Ramlibacter sp. PS4R-6 TaxID=3133438 RepID=UPI0030B00E9B
MNIYVDESGTFTADAARPGSWCVVAAYVSPETDRRKIEDLMRSMRRQYGGGREVKISDLPEPVYLQFLRDLARLNGLLFAVAIDVGLHDRPTISAHQAGQVTKVVEHIDKMIYPEGRAGVQNLADEIAALPLQLYTQLQCQLQLFHAVLRLAPVYFVQRFPGTLSAFRWRLDRKDTVPTPFEQAFRHILPAILQTMSMRDPMIQLIGANYRHMARFEFPDGRPPEYLKDAYGIEVESGLDVGKIVREDFKFVDSAAISGVQIADLCASGIRRLFRNKLSESKKAAALLGANMLQTERGRRVMPLITFGREAALPPEHSDLIRILEGASRAMLTRSLQDE